MIFEFFVILVLAWIGSKVHDVGTELAGIRRALDRGGSDRHESL